MKLWKFPKTLELKLNWFQYLKISADRPGLIFWRLFLNFYKRFEEEGKNRDFRWHVIETYHRCLTKYGIFNVHLDATKDQHFMCIERITLKLRNKNDPVSLNSGTVNAPRSNYQYRYQKLQLSFSRNIMIAIELLQNEEERKKKEKRKREREREKEKISNWNYITVGQKRD